MIVNRNGGLASVLAVSLAFAGVWPGGEARSESLADALVMAYNASPELVSGRANIKALGEVAVQAAAQGRVQVQGTINLTTQLRSLTPLGNFQRLNRFVFPTTMQLDVTQPLYTGGQIENATEAAETRITAEEARLIATEQSVLLNTVIAYLDVRRDQTLVSLGRNNVRVIKEQLRAARERFDVGEVTRTDVAQAEARLAAARSLLAATQGQLAASKEAYRRLVGQYPGKLQPPPPLPDLPDSIDAAIKIAQSDEPSIRAARLDRLAASSDVRSAIGSLLPQISLLGQVTKTDTINVDEDSQTAASVGVQVVIPFYSGGANYSQIRQAQAVAEGADAAITLAIKNVRQQVGVAWSDLNVARASIRAGKLEVRAANIAFDGVKEEAKVGARTTLDVLDAEQELLDARGSLVTARRDEYVAAYNLLFSVGKLTTGHLGLDVGDVPSVSEYYASVKDRNFGYDQTDDTVWSLSYRP